MRARNIKPGFFQNEDLAELPPEARLLFIGLWLMADREGRLEDRPKRIKMQIFPADDWDVDALLRSLHASGLIIRYEAGDGKYIEIPKFLEHQRPHHQEKESSIPPRLEKVRTKVRSRSRQGTSQSALNPESLNPESLNPDTGKEDVAQERDAPVTTVFNHWRQTHSHPKAKLDAKRRKLIRDRLNDYSEADLCQAITGYLNSPHHMGETDGTVYDSIELFLRDSKHVDMGLKFARDPPRKISALTRRNVAATENWTPPEVRHANN